MRASIDVLTDITNVPTICCFLVCNQTTTATTTITTMQHQQQQQQQQQVVHEPVPPNHHFGGYGVYMPYMAPTDNDQASYVRALGETHSKAADFDRTTRHLTDTLALGLPNDVVGQKAALEDVRFLSETFESLKTKALAAMSARVYYAHYNKHLLSQLRHCTSTNSTYVNQLSQQRRTSREVAMQNQDLRARVEHLETTLENTQMHATNLASDLDVLRRQCHELGTASTSNAERYERGERFFAVLRELVANYETGACVNDVAMNRGLTNGAELQLSPRPPAPPAREPHQCVMCLGQHATVVARPCNHLISCSACAIELARRHGVNVTMTDVVTNVCAEKFSEHAFVPCPRCRANVDDFLYIFA